MNPSERIAKLNNYIRINAPTDLEKANKQKEFGRNYKEQL